MATKSLFDKKGRLVYAIDFSARKESPNDVKNFVRNNYENYTITGVTKVEKDGRKIWVANLPGTKNYIAVKVEDGEIGETESFKRQIKITLIKWSVNDRLFRFPGRAFFYF